MSSGDCFATLTEFRAAIPAYGAVYIVICRSDTESKYVVVAFVAGQIVGSTEVSEADIGAAMAEIWGGLGNRVQAMVKAPSSTDAIHCPPLAPQDAAATGFQTYQDAADALLAELVASIDQGA